MKQRKADKQRNKERLKIHENRPWHNPLIGYAKPEIVLALTRVLRDRLEKGA